MKQEKDMRDMRDIDTNEKLRENLQSVLNGEEKENIDIQSCFNSKQISILSKGYRLVYFRVDNIKEIYLDKIKSPSKLRKNIENIIIESISKVIEYEIVFLSNHSGVILINDEKREVILASLNDIAKNIMKYLNITLSIIISKKCNDMIGFFDSFSNIIEAFDWKFYLGKGSIIEADLILDFKDIDLGDIFFHIELINKMQERSFDAVRILLDISIKYMIENQIQPSQVKQTFEFILANIEGNEMKNGLKKVDKFEVMKMNIKRSENIEELKLILKQGFLEIEKCIKDCNNRRYRKEVQSIINYVDKNIKKKITLKMIADNVNMNESYLSRMFKGETGKNLIYFINEKKMKVAIELLSDNSIMIKEVAQKVGIEDQFYFNRMFKKFYGMNPSEFKKRH